jgi:hypothetical protein
MNLEENMPKFDAIFSRNIRAWIILAFLFLIPGISCFYELPMALEYFFAIGGLIYWIALFIYWEINLIRIDKSNLIYVEWTASGSSHLNLLTELGGARGCLKIQLTKDYLLISTWFPFSLIAPLFDGVQIIPTENILSIKKDRGFLGRDKYLLTFKTNSFDQIADFSVYPKKVKQFESVFSKYLTT